MRTCTSIIYFAFLGSQFRRCLDQNLALVLTDEEFEELLSKYDNKAKGMINYIDFIESVQACKNLHVSNQCLTVLAVKFTSCNYLTLSYH